MNHFCESVVMEPKDPTHLNFRTTPEGAAWIDTVAERHNVSRTQMVRSALTVAARHEEEVDEAIVARK